MRKTAMSRGEPLARGGRLKFRSDKVARLYREERVPLVIRLLEERPWCEFPGGCGARSVDVHELHKRSGGGSITDEANLATSCRFHNDWAEQQPLAALAIGWVRR